MKISFFTNSLHRWSIEKSFETASRFGYDGIEIWGGRPHAYVPDMRPEDIERIKGLSRKYKLPIVSYTPDITPTTASILWRDERWLKESLDYLYQCIDFCKAIDCPKMVMAVFQCDYTYTIDENWPLFIKYMKELAAYSEKIDGVTLMLETLTPWEGNIMTRSDEVVRALKEINSPKVKAMVDLVAPLTVGEPSSNYFDRLGKDLVHVHLLDGNKDSEDHLILGDGELPMEEVLLMLDYYGYDGYCTIELFDEYRTEPILFNQRAIKKVREAMDRLGLKQG